MPHDPTTVWGIVAAITLLSNLGVIAWAVWSLERIAEKAANHAEAKVLKALDDHKEAEHAHPKMIDGWERRRDDRLHEILDNLTEVIRVTVLAAAKDALHLHNEDPAAHHKASEHNHGPMNTRITMVERELAKIRMAHNIVAETGKHKPIKDGDE